MTTLAAVLAAGAGSRFEHPTHKLLADFRGRPLVAWAIQHALVAGLDEVVVVTGAVDLAAIVPPTVAVIANPRWSDGLATSVHAAVRHAEDRGHDAVVIGLGDQPLVAPSAWRDVADAPASPPIAVATFGGRRAPPARLPSSVWTLLPTTGDIGARDLISGRPELVREVPCDGEPVDVDTVEDLARWS